MKRLRHIVGLHQRGLLLTRADDPESVIFWLRVLIRRFPIQVGLLIGVLVTCIPIVLLAQENNTIKVTQNQERSLGRRNCRRANVQNAYVRLRIPQDKLAVKIFPIIYCNAALTGEQRGVPMRHDQQKLYITLIGEGRLPIVGDGGMVIDSIPFPPGGPTGREIDEDDNTKSGG